MTLHVSETCPPNAEQIEFARIVDAALAEAGFPLAYVSVTNQTSAVSVIHHLDGEAGARTPSLATIKRAFEVARASKAKS